MRIDMSALALPDGWGRRLVRLEDGGSAVLLTARHPAGTLRIPARIDAESRPVLTLCREPGTFCEMEVKIGGGYWRAIRPAYFTDDRDGGIQEAMLDPLGPGPVEIRIRPIDRLATVSGLAGIRFEAAPQRARWRKEKVGAVCDTHGMFARSRVGQSADIEAMLAPFVESDFDRICWGVAAGSFRTLHFSDVLPYFGEGKRAFSNEPNTKVAATMEALRRRGVDPIEAGLRFCRAHGMEFWASDRICHCWPPGSFDDDFAAPFYLENQHLRTVRPDGGRAATLSLAHRQFQNLKIAVYRELAEKGVDGIYIDLQRKPGVMGMDEPVVREFERQVGRRPEAKDYRSESWLRIRAEFATHFMRRVRRALDEVGARQGRRIPLAAQGFSGRSYNSVACRMFDENMLEGYDIKTWAEEGLIDIFAPSASRHWRPISLTAFSNALDGTRCALWGCLGQHHDSLFPADYDHRVYFGSDPDKRITPISDIDPLRVLRNAAEFYAQGAEGVFLWEAGGVPNCPAQWEYLRTMGHREEWAKAFGAPIGPFDSRLRIDQIRFARDSTA